MRAVVIDRPHHIEIREIPDPVMGPGDILVKVMATGICGTDLHIVEGEFPIATYPNIPGHELAGEIVAIGAEAAASANELRVGDRVGIDPTLNCTECFFCKRGQYNLCERFGAVGLTYPGGFAEYVVVPVRTAYKLPDSMSYATGAMIEPVCCAVRGFHRLSPQIGESYLIYGAGPMGLINAQMARFNGASAVAMIDINEGRLERARTEFGIEHVATSLDELRDLAPRGFDNVIEATGVTKVASIAMDAVIRGGKLLLFGVCPPGQKAEYEAYRIYNQEITIMGTMAVRNSYGPALDILATGKIDADKMVSHTLPLADFEEAVDLAKRGVGMKVQVAPNG
ncbi:MAG TPA: zinc-dependent alcohol dehydrogenase family protein [Thermomicrobiales bacterium]|jgi:2-desacetyl-2-hydroxyethyl bacteriochlorophyllide A dehydrogenase|nr:zinc-dependent alcohol dehydrogenase family protein [Thermomicrobiales bacterium]